MPYEQVSWTARDAGREDYDVGRLQRTVEKHRLVSRLYFYILYLWLNAFTTYFKMFLE